MNTKLKNMSLSLKTTMILASILSLILISLTVFSAIYTKNIVSNKVSNQLEERLHQIHDTLTVYDDLLKTTADSLYNAFSMQFKNVEINTSTSIKVNGVDTPLITNNGEQLNNNFHYVDNYTKLEGSTATVFARVNDDFIRVTTSLKRTDGSRTLGTFLGTKSPAYDAIMKGEKYFGTASLFGSEYMAVYNPIMKNGEVIGIFYVGYNYTKSYKDLKNKLKELKVGDSGYLYILSTKAKSKGLYILHPSKEGQNILKDKSSDTAHIKEMFKNGQGIIDYEWKDPKTSQTKEKTVIYEEYKDRSWKLVLGTTKDEFLKESREFTFILSILSIISVIAIIIVILIIIKKLVINPVHNLQDGLNKFFDFLNRKSDKTDLIKVNSNDELGQMSTLVNANISQVEKNLQIDNELIQETVQTANKVKDGFLDTRINNSSNNPALNDLKDVVNDMLSNIENNLTNIENVLSSFTDKKYKNRLEANQLQAQMKNLYSNINTLGESSSKMLCENLKVGYTLQSNSNNLSTITSKLSNSSNQQAASLEETAASLEELTSTMSNNEANMANMSVNANKLQSAIVSGEQLASKTVNSMDLINTQTDAIAEAITVIDQISFQTNILSLNAAVEAATAGEAGKGFAVVAAEVRNLASRSAEAAKEIKDLVENATLKANEGKTIANDMINGYKDLNSNVHETASMIDDVSSNFKEQVKGLSQINDTVASLDQMTQQNATIATNANEIAQSIDSISSNIVEDTLAQDFEGKENI